MEVNWTFITYLVVGLFALSGYYRGWWKEAIVLFFLTILVFLLQQPQWAEWLIEQFNALIAFLWSLYPPVFETLFNDVLAIKPGGQGVFQADPTQGETWFTIMVLLIVGATLYTRANLTEQADRMGSLLGAMVGGLNGFVAINLTTEYMSGTHLPTGGASDMAMAGDGMMGGAPGTMIRATEMPSFTILDSFLPWLIMIVGLLVFITAVRQRVEVTGKGFTKREVKYHKPYGYK